MIGQMQMTSDGRILDKVEMALERLRAFEPKEGYYVAFSGGKDSQCIYHLCKMAGVKFDAHYAVTSVDPPELVRFIKRNYPDVEFERQYDRDGKPITMWNLIDKHKMPPTRKVRYCCASLKEPGGGRSPSGDRRSVGGKREPKADPRRCRISRETEGHAETG